MAADQWAISARPADQYRYDLAVLGEVLLELDPGPARLRRARSFTAREGGAEYNVGYAASRCFGMKSTIVTGLADNEVGHLVADLMTAAGVDLSNVIWLTADRLGRASRNGIYFVDHPPDPSLRRIHNDRGNSAASHLLPGQIDWERLFNIDGARWFHTGGIFVGVSPASAEIVRWGMEAARRAGTRVSYQINYEADLWQDIGGSEIAREINLHLIVGADLIFGDFKDYRDGLKLPLESTMSEEEIFDIAATRIDLPPLCVITRFTPSDTIGLGSLRTSVWQRATGQLITITQHNLLATDTIGALDSLIAGFLAALVGEKDVSQALAWGAAHAALCIAVHGERAAISPDEVSLLAQRLIPVPSHAAADT